MTQGAPDSFIGYPTNQVFAVLDEPIELEGCGCTHVRGRGERLEFEVPSDAERWILVGGLARLLCTYGDVVTWTPAFSEHGRG